MNISGRKDSAPLDGVILNDHLWLISECKDLLQCGLLFSKKAQ